MGCRGLVCVCARTRTYTQIVWGVRLPTLQCPTNEILKFYCLFLNYLSLPRTFHQMTSQFETFVACFSEVSKSKGLKHAESSRKLCETVLLKVNKILNQKKATTVQRFRLPGRLHKPETSRVLSFFSSSATRFPRILKEAEKYQEETESPPVSV